MGECVLSGLGKLLSLSLARTVKADERKERSVYEKSWGRDKMPHKYLECTSDVAVYVSGTSLTESGPESSQTPPNLFSRGNQKNSNGCGGGGRRVLGVKRVSSTDKYETRK